MELDLTVDSLDAVPEPLRAAYVAKDGKFTLAVKGMEDTSGLKSALEKERTARKENEAKVKRWEALGKSDEEIAVLLKAQADAEAKRKREEGDFDALLKQHETKWTQEREALSLELQAAQKSERQAIIETKVIAALVKAGATEEGVDLLVDRMARQIKFDTKDGERVLRIVLPDGETPMAGGAKDGTATFDDLVAEFVKKYPGQFKAVGGSGGGKPPGSGAGGSGKRKSDFKTEKERAAYVEAHGLDAYRALPA